MSKILRNFTVNSGKYVIIIAFVQQFIMHAYCMRKTRYSHVVSLEQMHSLKAELIAPIRCTSKHFNKCRMINDQ